MVIVRLVGGLGNQLFQYAAARRLAIWHNTTFKLDISAFESYTRRVYSLYPFNIQEDFATPEEVVRLREPSQGRLRRAVFRLKRMLRPYNQRTSLREWRLNPYNPNFLRTSAQVYLDGYWQTEKYFVDIADIVRREFTIKYAQDLQNRAVAEEIAATQAVSVHVRRGDYVSDPPTSQVHGVCGLDYYARCVSLIAQKVPSPHFFVFSDDPDWVVQNLHLDYPTTLVSQVDPSKSYEDLRLMSLCRHHIIANSSFSWWGAWLNAKPGKLVFAPQRWFQDTSVDTRDLLPEGWIKV
jgi:hypothetical protein